MSAHPWEAAERILCVRLDALGDVLMTTPAIRALRESGRRRRILLLTSPAGARAADLVPEIDEILVYEAPWIKASPPPAGSAGDEAMVARIRAAAPDAAAIFTVYSQNPLPAAFLCHLAGVPLRLGHCRENPYHLLTDWVPEPEPQAGVRHEVRRQLDLVQRVGARTADERLSLRVPAAARRGVADLLAGSRPARDRPRAVVHPGATAASRRYPPERFAQVVRGLVRDLGCEVLLTGTAEEAPLAAHIAAAAGVPAQVLAGRLSLGELAALLEGAAVLVSNNTGPVHVAAAVGTPVVVLYALTNPQHTPWRVPSRVLFHDVPCRYCYKSICPEGHQRCLSLVSPKAVLAAAHALLRGGPEALGTMKVSAPAAMPGAADHVTGGRA